MEHEQSGNDHHEHHDHAYHEQSHEQAQVTKSPTQKPRFVHTSWLVTQYAFDRLVDVVGEDLEIIRREIDLFLGMALIVLGVFNFRTGKYCDGNATDYLSCTRPSAYYYYGFFEIFLIIVGVFLFTLWFFKRSKR